MLSICGKHIRHSRLHNCVYIFLFCYILGSLLSEAQGLLVDEKTQIETEFVLGMTKHRA